MGHILCVWCPDCDHGMDVHGKTAPGFCDGITDDVATRYRCFCTRTTLAAAEAPGRVAALEAACSDRGCLHYDHEEPPCVGHVPSIFSKLGNISKKRDTGCDNCSESIYGEGVKVTYTDKNGHKTSARCHNKECANDRASGMKGMDDGNIPTLRL